LGYTWNGYVEFGLQLDVPNEHAEDGSIKKLGQELRGDAERGFPGPYGFEVSLTSVSGPALGAMVAEQGTQSIFVVYRGPVAFLEPRMRRLRELCDDLFPRAH
jgi:hypothetical protein